jgi:sterol desaturase/sphingolipid hydroxylase (fatty acid hydroxylase superfamily)
MLETLNETYQLITKALLPLPSAHWSLELTGEAVAFTLLLCFAGLSNLESRFPKIKRSLEQTRKSYQANINLFAFNSLLMSLCSVSTLFVIAEHYSGFGLLNYISNPVAKAVLAFLAFDLLLYGWHRLCHQHDSLWLFHRVHHNDPYLNVSTAFRLHFVEILVTNSLKALLIVLLGIDKILVLMAETLITLGIMFHHTNISFRHERSLGRFFIMPYLHRTHHSAERSEHDSNYGAALAIWDRIFGTLSEAEPKKIGIKGESPQDFLNLVKFGLGLDWRKPTSVYGNTFSYINEDLDAMIAEAAYYRAEKRNFYPGYEMRDWLEAKADIMKQVNRQQRQAADRQKDRFNFNSFFQHDCEWLQSLKNLVRFGI